MKYGYVIVDTETSGLIPSHNSLLTVGMIFTNNDMNHIKLSIELPICDDKNNINEKAIDINNLDVKMIKNLGIKKEDFITFMNKMKEILDVDKFILVGWNVNFDISFIKQFIGENAYNEIFHYKHIDIISIYWYIYGKFPKSLKNVCKELELEFDEDKCHTALYDAYLTYKMYEKIK